MKRRTTALLGVAVVLAAGGAYVGHRLATGGEVTEVGVAEALARYREQTASTTTAPPADATSAPPAAAAPTTEVAGVTSTTAPVVVSLVAPGVYQYATSGFDRVDVLTGARHDYPTTTTITVVPHGCGVRLRWDVAVERWDSWDWCLDGDAVRQTGWVGYHEFFGTAGPQRLHLRRRPAPARCARGHNVGDDVPHGRPHDDRLHRHGDRAHDPHRCGHRDPRAAPSIRRRRGGESTGRQSVEGWYRMTDGLPVREHLTISTKQDTVVGTTNFDETYTIDLLTPTPAS